MNNQNLLKIKKIASLVIVWLVLSCQSLLWAQVGGEFQLADRLMRQQQYQAALDILVELVEKAPNEYYYFEKMIESYIQLKQYDNALEQVEKRLANNNYTAREKILEAKIYYLKGDKEKAHQIWDKNIAANSNELQVYMISGQVFSDMHEYDKAITTYKNARKTFGNDQLFMNEIADAYMKTGQYEGAVQEWFNVIKIRPNQRAIVQRILLRYDDPIVYDIALMELDDEMSALKRDDKLYTEFYQLQSWILQENKLFKSALNNAIKFEESSNSTNYAVYNLAGRLLDAKEYELAAQAYQFYENHQFDELRWQSAEKLSDVYKQWAKYNEKENLTNFDNVDSLYNKAIDLLNEIYQKAPNYSRLGNIIVSRAEIELDHTLDFNAAKKTVELLAKREEYKDSEELHYLEGRIHLVDKNFTQARISFTKSNKIADIGAMAEKTRYFLALTDFFSGDYEFANIQLKSLGRQNTSFYANDAIELRLWLQKTKPVDSTNTATADFADAFFSKIAGNEQQSYTKLMEIALDEKSAFREDALLLLASHKKSDAQELSLLIDEALKGNNQFVQKEKLMWNRATNADMALNEAQNKGSNSTFTPDDVADYYEELLDAYPQSFYASHARKRLAQLINLNS